MRLHEGRRTQVKRAKHEDSFLTNKKLATISHSKRHESSISFAYDLSRDTQLPNFDTQMYSNMDKFRSQELLDISTEAGL